MRRTMVAAIFMCACGGGELPAGNYLCEAQTRFQSCQSTTMQGAALEAARVQAEAKVAKVLAVLDSPISCYGADQLVWRHTETKDGSTFSHTVTLEAKPDCVADVLEGTLRYELRVTGEAAGQSSCDGLTTAGQATLQRSAAWPVLVQE